MEKGPIAGLAIAVVQDDEVLHARTYGWADVANSRPVTEETVFNIASVAKIIAAAAVLRLVDEGRLSLDDDLATLLPDFPNPEQGRRITLRQLLNHTSGLNDYVAAEYERWEQEGTPLDPSFVLDYVRDRPLDFEPGTHWIYSNTAFYLAGLIVERVTGQPWGEVVIEDVARPLGLHSAVLCDEAGDLRTLGYDVTEAGFGPSVEDAEQGVRGDAGLCMTALDAARLPSALAENGLLTDESLREMLSPTVLDTGVPVDYGLGVALGTFDGHSLWGHLGGNSSSYVAALIHYPEDEVTIAALVNTRYGRVGALLTAGRIAGAVLALNDSTLADVPLSARAQQSYLGVYEGDRRPSRYRMVSDGSRITRVVVGDSTARRSLLYQGDHTFGRTDWPMDRLAFHVADGHALGYSVYYFGLFDGFYRRIGP